jgi:MATE family multidrug resistance protein
MSFSSELKSMLRLAGPVIVAELGWMTMGLIDTAMVSPLGPEAIGATGVASGLHFVFAIFGMGLLLGLDTLVSQAHGAGDERECVRWLVDGLWLAVLAAGPLLALSGVVLHFVPDMAFHEDIVEPLSGYFAVALWSTVPLLGFAALRRYLQATHIVKPIVFALVSANVVDIIGNWVFIYGNLGVPALGVPGAAWTTLLARVWMMTVLLVAVWLHLRKYRAGVAGVPRGIDTGRIRQLLRLGLPAASQVTLEVGVFSAATALAGSLDPVASASHQIALNIAAFCFMVPLGISSAGAVRVGSHVGARDMPSARLAGWTAIAIGIASMMATALLFFVIPRQLIGLFSRDPAVLALGASLLFVAAVFQLFDGVQGVATGVLRGIGETRVPMLTNLVGHWFIGLPIGYALCFSLGAGVTGLWWGLSIGLIVCAVVLLWVWHRRISRFESTPTGA